MILFTEGINEIPPYLREALSNQHLENIPTYSISNISEITAYLKNILQKNIPIINGLVLVGG